MRRYTLSTLLILCTVFTHAQGITDTQDFFKSNLKIYVVVAVLAIILSCLFIFLFGLEKRLKVLEKQDGMRP